MQVQRQLRKVPPNNGFRYDAVPIEFNFKTSVSIYLLVENNKQ